MKHATMSALLFVALVAFGTFATEARKTPRRRLTQGGPKPEECHHGFNHSDDWSKDEIDCKICGRQFNCEFDRAILFDSVDEVECELDLPGLFADYDFDGPVLEGKLVACNWTAIDPRLPSCAIEPLHRIMDLWRPE